MGACGQEMGSTSTCAAISFSGIKPAPRPVLTLKRRRRAPSYPPRRNSQAQGRAKSRKGHRSQLSRPTLGGMRHRAEAMPPRRPSPANQTGERIRVAPARPVSRRHILTGSAGLFIFSPVRRARAVPANEIRIAFIGDSMSDGIWGGIVRATAKENCLKFTFGRYGENGTGLTWTDMF